MEDNAGQWPSTPSIRRKQVDSPTKSEWDQMTVDELDEAIKKAMAHNQANGLVFESSQRSGQEEQGFTIQRPPICVPSTPNRDSEGTKTPTPSPRRRQANSATESPRLRLKILDPPVFKSRSPDKRRKGSPLKSSRYTAGQPRPLYVSKSTGNLRLVTDSGFVFGGPWKSPENIPPTENKEPRSIDSSMDKTNEACETNQMDLE